MFRRRSSAASDASSPKSIGSTSVASVAPLMAVMSKTSLGARSRAPTSAVEDVHELWAENQDLYARIADLESKLEEVEEDNAEMTAMFQQSNAVGATRSRSKSPSVTWGLGSIKRCSYSASKVDLLTSQRDKIEELTSQRSRLLWQKAILAVRLQCSIVGKVTSKIKSAGIEFQLSKSRHSVQELQRQLTDSLRATKIQQIKFEADAEKFREEKVELEFALQDQMCLRKSQVSSSQLGCHDSHKLSVLSELDIATATSGAGSLAEDLERIVSSDAIDLFSSHGPSGLARALAQVAEQDAEIEQLRSYSKLLEEKLVDAMAENEELEPLRRRILQLEKIAQTGGMVQGQEQIGRSWWCATPRTLCSTARA